MSQIPTPQTPVPASRVSKPRVDPRVAAMLAQNIELQRTLIPPFLMVGVLSPIVGMMGYIVEADSVFSGLRGGFSVALFAVGLAMLGAAGFTMMGLKKRIASFNAMSN